MRQALDVVEDGGACRGKTRCCFEESVYQSGDAAMNQERKHAENREDDPRSCYHHIRIATTQTIVCISSRVEE